MNNNQPAIGRLASHRELLLEKLLNDLEAKEKAEWLQSSLARVVVDKDFDSDTYLQSIGDLFAVPVAPPAEAATTAPASPAMTGERLWQQRQPSATLTRVGRAILRELYRQAPCLLTQAQIAAADDEDMPRSVRTIGPELRKLIDQGLVYRPNGQRKGVTLTETGLAAIKKILGKI